MLKKTLRFLFDTRLMAALLVAFAVAMAAATFIENDYGPATSKALVYNTFWFALIMALLGVNFVGNIFRYRLYRKEKWVVLLFHLSFIVILIGAGITRYIGFEGTLPIREGSQASTLYSDRTYITVRVDNDKVMKDYESSVLFGQRGGNAYRLRDNFGVESSDRIPFSISLDRFTARAKETFVADDSAPALLHIVQSGGAAGKRNDIYLRQGETKNVDGIPFAFDHYVEGGFNFFQTPEGVSLQPPFDGECITMQTRASTPVLKDSVAALRIRHLYAFEGLRFVAPQGVQKGTVSYATASKEEQDKYPYDVLAMTVRSGALEKQIYVKGRKGALSPPTLCDLNGLHFAIGYGSKGIKMPFSVRLRDFQMDRYPGTNSASSYASEVTVLDGERTFDHRIYMNHVLNYRGYRFFQASYDTDEKGTILSVNHDYWGTLVTYVGYSLMGLGMMLTLFSSRSRFGYLSRALQTSSKNAVVVLALLLAASVAQAQPADEAPQHVVRKDHAEAFGRLLIQDHQGRIKPVNTYALEALRKVHKKSAYKTLNAEQVLLAAQLDPRSWGRRYMIKVKTAELGKALCDELQVKDGLLALTNCFSDGEYLLKDKAQKALQTEKTSRNATDQEIINLNERVNVWWSMLSGELMLIYPKKNDPNRKWYAGIDRHAFTGPDTMVYKMHQLYMTALQQAVHTDEYAEADEYLALISQYQRRLADDIAPSMQKVNLEISYNRWAINKKLIFYYMAIGLALLTLAFIDLLSPGRKSVRIGLTLFVGLSLIGLLIHGAGLAMRWYISDHAPWSNGYEAVVFVAFITVLAGMLLSYNKSKFTAAATVLFASFLLGIARGSMMNPEITNLVPVLKSYWLMVHVAVITASYGFLGLGSLLGFTVLLLYILRTPANAPRLNKTIDELTYTHESTLTIGVFVLAIGTFLGGIWANESWGRYWGWDPKEVWALISVIVYVFVLHMRLVPGLRGSFTFNVVGLFSISTLIMTFFGVNYYLSGLHSYAGGDPVPIPDWIYIAIAFFVLFSVVSYIRYRQFNRRVNP